MLVSIYFPEKRAKTQRGWITSPRSHSWQMWDSAFAPRSVGYRSYPHRSTCNRYSKAGGRSRYSHPRHHFPSSDTLISQSQGPSFTSSLVSSPGHRAQPSGQYPEFKKWVTKRLEYGFHAEPGTPGGLKLKIRNVVLLTRDGQTGPEGDPGDTDRNWDLGSRAQVRKALHYSRSSTIIHSTITYWVPGTVLFTEGLSSQLF